MATGGKHVPTRHVKDDAAVGGKMPVMCDPCGRRKRTTPAAVACSSCDMNLCRECRQVHEIYAAGEHVFVAIDENATENLMVDMQGLDVCSEHDRLFLYICKDHDTLCCEYCHFDFHRTCKDMYKLKDMNSAVDSAVNGYIDKMQEVIVRSQEMIDNSQITVQANDECMHEIMSDIDSKKEEIIKRFDEAKRRIRVDLDEVIMWEKTRLDDVKHEAESVKGNLQNLMSLAEAVDQHGTDIEKSILNFTCKQKTTWATTKLTELQNSEYTVQHTLEWTDHLLAVMEEPLVTLRHVPRPSAMGTDTADNDHDVGKAFFHISLKKVIVCVDHKSKGRCCDNQMMNRLAGIVRLYNSNNEL